MNEDLTMLYTVKANLDKRIEVAIAHLPVSRERVAVMNAIAEFEASLKSTSDRRPKVSKPRLVKNGKPRTLTNPQERGAIIAWLKGYFRRNGNKATSGKVLTEMMQQEGLVIPGDHPASVVGGILSRNKEFKGQNGFWQLAAEYAA